MKFRDVAIVELEHLVGASKRQILERESFYIENTPGTVNKRIPINDKKEYIECACGCYIRKIRRNIRQHINGRDHPKKMTSKGLLVNSIDGQNEINYSDFHDKSNELK